MEKKNVVNEIVQVGMYGEGSYLVGEEHSAIHIGSGSSRVLATPMMIAFMERVSHALLAEYLPTGYSSVGTLVNVRHVAPTPIGKNVRIRTEITEVDDRRVVFTVQAWDERELIGMGQHERFVIEEARFLKRVDNKRIEGAGR